MDKHPVQFLEYYLCKFITYSEKVIYNISLLDEVQCKKIAKSIVYIKKYCEISLKEPLDEDTGLDINILSQLINEQWTKDLGSLLSSSTLLLEKNQPKNLEDLLKEWALASTSEKDLFFEDLKNLAEDLFIRT